jgi:hypothetical protein
MALAAALAIFGTGLPLPASTAVLMAHPTVLSAEALAPAAFVEPSAYDLALSAEDHALLRAYHTKDIENRTSVYALLAAVSKMPTDAEESTED